MLNIKNFKIGFIALLALTSTNSFAQCFKFQNAGPSAIGATPLYSTASLLCISSTGGFGGSDYSFRLYNNNNELIAGAGASLTQAREPNGEMDIDLSFGNANGQNVNFAGTRVMIHGGFVNQSGLRLVTITGMNQSFYVSGN